MDLRNPNLPRAQATARIRYMVTQFYLEYQKICGTHVTCRGLRKIRAIQPKIPDRKLADL